MSEDGYLLKDLGSPNGTFVNGERITEHRLQKATRSRWAEGFFTVKAS